MNPELYPESVRIHLDQGNRRGTGSSPFCAGFRENFSDHS